MIQTRLINKIFILCTIVIILAISVEASAKILISPTRVVFSEKDRVQEVILINTASERQTYRIEWEEKLANPLGGYIEEFEPSAIENSAQEYIRFSPRQVSLAPGERQIVKLMVRRSNRLTANEYRSHLKFIVIPPDLTPTEKENSSDGIRMKLNFFMNYSLPVILRTQKPNANMSITNARIVTNPISQKTELQIDLTRLGQSSYLGDIKIIHKLPNGDNETVGQLNHINFFGEHKQFSRNIIFTKDVYELTGPIEVQLRGTKEFSKRPINTFLVRR